MPMTLVFKRAKCFVDQESGTKKFLAQAGPASPIPVPFWVARTDTYKQGIKDESIVNLTPPHLMPGYKIPDVVVPVTEDEEIEQPKPVPVDVDDEETVQESKPTAPFGGQPMTPVQPGPKVGLRSGSGKGR